MYTLRQVCDYFHISASTLRYYESMQILYDVPKNASGQRYYLQKHIDWLKLILCLRTANLGIKELQQYVSLCREGKSTVSTRYDLIHQKRLALEQDIEKLKQAHEKLIEKEQHYLKQMASAKDAINPEDSSSRLKRIK